MNNRERNFNKNWYFKLNAGPGAKEAEVDLSDWKKLDLPHDWSIQFDFDHQSPAQNEGGQLNGGDAWYRKVFQLNEEDLGKRVRILFDGVYMDSQVYVNGQLVGHYPNGYNHFSYDLTPYLNRDGSENSLAVHVVNQQPSSRWYSGSGIYRDVHLIVTDPVHLPLYANQIQSPKLKEQQDGLVETQITTRLVNEDEQEHRVKVTFQLFDDQGQAVSEIKESSEAVIAGRSDRIFHEVVEVERPQLWTVTDPKPALYHLITKVYRDTELVDSQREFFGYRYMDWTPEGGFFLNGVATKFHGVSLHHDHGALGAVENEKAEYRRLKQMKEMGVNAIRTTHNPASPQTLEIAARLGLMVQEEAFDTWYGGKKTYDYGRFFDQEASHPEARPGEKWSDYDLRTMVERDRNNPAIVMWSVGNEVGEADGSEKSLATVRRLVKTVKEVDATRYVTMGADKFRFGDGSGGHEAVAAELDAVGLNYSEGNYEGLRAKHPDWLIYGSETSSATRTRGSYFHPESEWVGSNQEWRHFEQSDYGNDRVGWGRTATASWTFDRDHAGYAGQFVWTGTDYIGEPTPWHNQNETPVKSSYFGIVDTAGLPKNDYYLYQSQWRSVDQYPMVHLLPHWNWDNQELADQVMDVHNRVPVRVFSNAPKVEFFVNGQSLGEKAFVKKVTQDGRTYQEGARPDQLYLEWLVPYVPGKVEAIAKDERGREIARDNIETAGEPAAVRLVKEEDVLVADGKDLTYIRYEIVDAEGRLVPTAKNPVYFHLHGQGQIVGVDNGEQASRERYQAQVDGSWTRKAFNGQGTIIVQSTQQAGVFTLYAHSDQLNGDQVRLYTKNAHQGEKDLLGYEPIQMRIYQGEVLHLPETVRGIYADGHLKEEPVLWEPIEMSQAGLYEVRGRIGDGRVTAHVQVVGEALVLPVVKSLPVGSDLESLDKGVSVILTDGSLVTSLVDRWEWVNRDPSQLEREGSQIELKGHLANGQEVTAQLRIGELKQDAEQGPQLLLNDQALPAFSHGQHTLFIPLPYGVQPGRVSVVDQDQRVSILQATPENGLRAQVYLIDENGALHLYAVQFQEETPAIERIEVKLPVDHELVEDHRVPMAVVAHYQDGSQSLLSLNQVQIELGSASQGKVVARDQELELWKAGTVDLRVSFEDQVARLPLTIHKNLETKVLKGIRPVFLSTDRGQIPRLPKTVLVEYDKGFPKEEAVRWESINTADLEHYQDIQVRGRIEGVDGFAEARIRVEGILAVEDVSVATPVGQVPRLPETVRVYHSSGKSYQAKVEWEALDRQLLQTVGRFVLEGQVEGTALLSHLYGRVSNETVAGANIAEQWTGSELPLAFASASHDADPVSQINDKLISYNNQPANRWTNRGLGHQEDFIGILFGDAGNLTKRWVDNLHLACYEDQVLGVPIDYVLEYYIGEELPRIPTDANHVMKEAEHPFTVAANWQAVSNLRVEGEVQAGRVTAFHFDPIESYALRIRMQTPSGKEGVGVTELQIFESQVLAQKQSQIRIFVDGKVLEGVVPSVQDYDLPVSDGILPTIEATASQDGVVTVIPSIGQGDPVRLIHKAENGELLQEYRLYFEQDPEGKEIHSGSEPEVADYGPLPSPAQIRYHQDELAAFLHFGLNTYYQREWGDGAEDPARFDPQNLDTEQWVRALKEAGFKRMILVVKHHDGFVLYPSRYTDHTVAQSPWKDGQGDVLAELSASASKYDMDMGIYLSPWDAHSPLYHVETQDRYNTYYLNQLNEILTDPKYGNQGKFVEVWMDGARGDGAQKVTYDFDRWFAAIHEAQGEIAIFSTEPTTVRWIGNENGLAGDPIWHKIDPEKIRNHPSNDYLNHGDPKGSRYSVGEADVSIRSGWFYHEEQEPKSLRELMEIYFKSVGRGTPLLLNIPPNPEGKFAEADIERLKEFRQTLDELFRVNFAAKANVKASSTRHHPLYKPEHLIDEEDETSWAPARDARTASLVLDLGQEYLIDVVELREKIEKGQRIAGFTIEVDQHGEWTPFGSGSTVGYRRLIQGQPVRTRYLRVVISDAQATPILNGIAVYKAPAWIEQAAGYPLGLIFQSDCQASRSGQWIEKETGFQGTSLWSEEKGASVRYEFTGSKAYLLTPSAHQPTDSVIYLDGKQLLTGEALLVDKKERLRLIATPDLFYGPHRLTIVNAGNAPVTTEGILVLQNQGIGLFELAEPTYAVKKGETVSIRMKRIGGSTGPASVKVVTEPGTGVHGRVYQDTNQMVHFSDGETEQTLEIPTINFAGSITAVYDFKVKLLAPTNGSLLGFNTVAKVEVMAEERLLQLQKEEKVD